MGAKKTKMIATEENGPTSPRGRQQKTVRGESELVEKGNGETSTPMRMEAPRLGAELIKKSFAHYEDLYQEVEKEVLAYGEEYLKEFRENHASVDD